MWSLYTRKFYLAIKKSKMKKFPDKQLKLENTMMKKVTKSRMTHTICSLKHADLSFASLAMYV